jgi:hypothetical protein
MAGDTATETSQNGGSPVMGGNACGLEDVGTKPAGSGGWNVPPANDFAVIEATTGNRRLLKLSQVDAAYAGRAVEQHSTIAEHVNTHDRLFIFFLPLAELYFS